MAKNIIREIIIILLLALAIILILGVLLYRYTAYNKVLPEEISYKRTEETAQEIQSSNTIGTEQPVLRYSVTASDLQTYERNREYTEGKRNPFADTETSSQSATSGTSSGSSTNANSSTNGNKTNTTNGNNTSSNTTNGNSTSTNENRFFPDTGTK